MKWFKHLVDSGDDPDIGAIVSKFGAKGYYLFFRTLEVMAREFDPDHPGENTFDKRWFLQRFYAVSTRFRLQSFFAFTTELHRIEYREEGENVHLTCYKLKDLTDEYTGKMMAKVSGQNPDTNRDIVGIPSPSPSSSKIKSKIKERPLRVILNLETLLWENITKEQMEVWSKAYPACDVGVCLEQMKVWVSDHLATGEGRKSNWPDFIRRWLAREQRDRESRGLFRPGSGIGMDHLGALKEKR
jgi:hypothetical protein